jgi:hypothetical protein
MSILYDKMMQMPLSSWLLATIIWFSAMLTGVLFGLGFNSQSLSTTILFLFIYGASAFLYGFSMSLDIVQALWLFIKNNIVSLFSQDRKPVSYQDVKGEVQALRKRKIISEMATGQAVDDATGRFIDTDIRPGEKRTPKVAPSLLAGLYTLALAGAFVIIFNIIFPPLT